MSIDPRSPMPIDPAGMMAHQAAGLERRVANLERRLFRMQGQDWHVIGDPGEPAFDVGWTHASNASNVRFFRDPFGIVHLDGTARKAALGSNQVFTLPEGFRPFGTSKVLWAARGVGESYAYIDGDSGDVVALDADGSEVNVSGAIECAIVHFYAGA